MSGSIDDTAVGFMRHQIRTHQKYVGQRGKRFTDLGSETEIFIKSMSRRVPVSSSVSVGDSKETESVVFWVSSRLKNAQKSTDGEKIWLSIASDGLENRVRFAVALLSDDVLTNTAEPANKLYAC